MKAKQLRKSENGVKVLIQIECIQLETLSFL